MGADRIHTPRETPPSDTVAAPGSLLSPPLTGSWKDDGGLDVSAPASGRSGDARSERYGATEHELPLAGGEHAPGGAAPSDVFELTSDDAVVPWNDPVPYASSSGGAYAAEDAGFTDVAFVDDEDVDELGSGETGTSSSIDVSLRLADASGEYESSGESPTEYTLTNFDAPELPPPDAGVILGTLTDADVPVVAGPQPVTAHELETVANAAVASSTVRLLTPPGGEEVLEPTLFAPEPEPEWGELPAAPVARSHTPPAAPVEVRAWGASPAAGTVRVPARKRALLLEAVRKSPLEPAAYRGLAEHFSIAGDLPRARFWNELFKTLDGAAPTEEVTPRIILSATDRAGLRHPLLRNDVGELLALCGLAFFRLLPFDAEGQHEREELRLDSGRGASHLADALLASVRILGLRAPDVRLSESQPLPLTLVPTPTGMQLLASRVAVKKALSPSELRFFAGRALFAQVPDLFALRFLSQEQVDYGLGVMAHVAGGGRLPPEVDADAFAEALPKKAYPRVVSLLESVGRSVDVDALADAARHSVNRAGLVVTGSLGPVLRALKAKGAPENELEEVVRFASSERFLGLKLRALNPSGNEG